MKTRTMFALVAMLSLSCYAQHRSDKPVRGTSRVEIVEDDSPCSIGKNPTVSQCWECFQSLLADCDRKNAETARRKACYDAANSFFTWCLGRTVSSPHGVSNITVFAPETMAMDSAFDYYITLDFEPSRIDVWIRDMKGVNIREYRVDAFYQKAQGGYTIHFDNTNSGIRDDAWVSVITVAVDNSGNPGAVNASTYDLINPLDLNNDGMVDIWDFNEAISQYNTGVMTLEQLQDFSTKLVNW